MKKIAFLLLTFASTGVVHADGELDTSFNVGGVGAPGSVPGIRATGIFNLANLVMPVTTPNTTRDFGAEGGGLIIQPDGKLILLGNEVNAGVTLSNFFMIRYNADGTLDTSFGTGAGRVTIGTGVTGDFTHGFDAVLDSNNKIIVVGTEQTGLDSLLIMRLNTDGTLDTTFNTTGFVKTNLTGTGEFLTRVALQSDGKIVAGGFKLGAESIVVRYNTDGTLDTTFNSGGAVPGVANDALGGPTNEQKVSDIFILPDDKILLVANDITSAGGNSALIVARLNSNGTLDATFNSGGTPGYFRTDFGNAGEVNAVHKLLSSQGKILLLGEVGTGAGTPNGLVVRLNADGTLDTTFGTAGRVVIDTPFGFFGGAVQADGKILAVGPDSVASEASVVRLNPEDASFDTTFDGDGTVLITDGVGIVLDFGTDIAIQDDGNIVFVGYNAFDTVDEVYIVRLSVNTNAASFKTPTATLFGKYRDVV